MLFDYIYSLTDFDPLFFSNPGTPVGEFIFPINEKTIGPKPELFKLLTDTKSRFCFCIPYALTAIDSKAFKKEVIENIVRLLFLPNYIRVHEEPVFFIEGTQNNNSRFQNLITIFFDELKKQGIKS